MRQKRQILPESSISYVWLILGFKAEKQLRNKNHTEDWALVLSLYKYIMKVS